jgi:hypothetical protein
MSQTFGGRGASPAYVELRGEGSDLANLAAAAKKQPARLLTHGVATLRDRADGRHAVPKSWRQQPYWGLT